MEDFEILFVDDDTTILSLVEEYLNAFNYRVSVVDNGLKALELIEERNFDVVFTDFKMPDINGLELLALIKEYRPLTEVIIVTGHGTMESAIQAMKYGSYDYLQKPFKLEHLRLIIDRITEEKKVAHQTQRLRKSSRQRHRYGRLIGLSPRMQAIYDLVGDQIRDTFDAQSVVLVTYDHASETLAVNYNFEKGERYYLPGSHPLNDLHRHLIENRQPVAAFGLVHVVRRHQDGGTGVDQLKQGFPEIPPCLWIDSTGRLVQEQQFRLVQRRGSQCQALPLATAERAGKLLRPGGQVVDFQQLVDTRDTLRCWQAIDA